MKPGPVGHTSPRQTRAVLCRVTASWVAVSGAPRRRSLPARGLRGDKRPGGSKTTTRRVRPVEAGARLRAKRDRQSVFVHLIGLCAVLEHDAPPTYATKLLGEVIRRRGRDFPILERAEGSGPLTVVQMVGATDLVEYERRAIEWATAVWDSWSAHHGVIRAPLRDATNPELGDEITGQ